MVGRGLAVGDGDVPPPAAGVLVGPGLGFRLWLVEGVGCALGPAAVGSGVPAFTVPSSDETCPVVSGSGLKTAEDFRRLRDAGISEALVGETLMRAGADSPLLQSLRQ